MRASTPAPLRRAHPIASLPVPRDMAACRLPISAAGVLSTLLLLPIRHRDDCVTILLSHILLSTTPILIASSHSSPLVIASPPPRKAIDWATSAATPLSSRINVSAGVGVAGHSMGGQATLYSSSTDGTRTHDIRAAAMHHPYTHSYPKPTVPYIVFTGDKDAIATPAMAEAIYAGGRGSSGGGRAFANKLNSGHQVVTQLEYVVVVVETLAFDGMSSSTSLQCMHTYS